MPKLVVIQPPAVVRRIGEAYERAVLQMQRMNQASEARPNNRYSALALTLGTPHGQVEVSFGPVVFKLFERSHHPNADLFVVVVGRLTVAGTGADTSSPLQSVGFGTEVAYFRHRGDTLVQVYGAHYDLDTSGPGHPAFHSQLATNDQLFEHVVKLFNLQEGTKVQPLSGELLKTVRVPCAQMDFLATITQLCADHLIGKDSSPETAAAFEELRGGCQALQGIATDRILADTECMRSPHWYHRS